MSEFSESYHLFTKDQNEGVRLLRRAWLRGFVFPETNHWVTLVASGSMFKPNKRLIYSNKGMLIHLINAEDHGWSISVYDGRKRTFHYACTWEEDIEIDQEEYNRERMVQLINNNPHRTQTVTPLDITKVFYAADVEELFERDPVAQITKLLGLVHFEWTSYEYMTREYQENADGMLKRGIKRVNGLLSFY